MYSSNTYRLKFLSEQIDRHLIMHVWVDACTVYSFNIPPTLSFIVDDVALV